MRLNDTPERPLHGTAGFDVSDMFFDYQGGEFGFSFSSAVITGSAAVPVRSLAHSSQSETVIRLHL